jgi:hypothetical protein
MSKLDQIAIRILRRSMYDQLVVIALVIALLAAGCALI